MYIYYNSTMLVFLTNNLLSKPLVISKLISKLSKIAFLYFVTVVHSSTNLYSNSYFKR